VSANNPCAQFMITGVLGPNSNAHGPNEFLHIPFARKRPLTEKPNPAQFYLGPSVSSAPPRYFQAARMCSSASSVSS
jgi:hypothetical protein